MYKDISLSTFKCIVCHNEITLDIDKDEKCPFCGKLYLHRFRFETKCSICGKIAMQDQYGNGECKNCGWKFSKDEEEFEKKLGISYPMLVTPTTAREQFKNGLPFKATFTEFINGLYFYSEMLFKYNNIMYEVFLKKDYTIVFCSSEMQQEYKNRQDFENKANINGVLLKDLWVDVQFAGFMYCGDAE